ncbi:beta-propeller fold lactonase family protein [bacterium]|nr:beta-propeller fold lactonase family protein [bacterium]
MARGCLRGYFTPIPLLSIPGGIPMVRKVVILFALLLMPLFMVAQTHLQVDPNGDPPFETRLAEPGETVTLQQLVHHELDEDSVSQDTFDAGVPPEGDFLGWGTFSPDGAKIWWANRMSDNVTVYDWETMTVDTTVAVGTYPAGVTLTEDYAIIPCAFEDEVYILNVNDYSVAASFTTGEQPWVVRLNDDSTKAYVACDIDDVCEVIDLETLTHDMTIENFPIALLSFSWGAESGRSSVKFSNFQYVENEDGGYLVSGGLRDSLWVIDAATGDVFSEIPMPGATMVKKSGDGQILGVLSRRYGNPDPPDELMRVGVADFSVIDSLDAVGTNFSFYGLAMNADGTKGYAGIQGNISGLFDFEDEEVVTFSNTYTAFWVGVNSDHSIAVSGQYRWTLVDFETESLLGSNWGNSQYDGIVSPTHPRVVGSDATARERLFFYDITDPNNPDLRGSMPAGQAPEGDAPRRCAISPDGSRAVVVNTVSETATLLDLDEMEVVTVMDMGGARPQNVAFTPDGAYALVGVYEAYQVAVIDVELGLVVAMANAGQRPGVLDITPDGEYAFVGNIQSNTVSVIENIGPDASEAAEINVGVIGVAYAGGSTQSDVTVSPDGNHALVACSFDDRVDVINTNTLSVESQITVGDFPLQIAVGEVDGTQYALVTNYFENSVSLLLNETGGWGLLATVNVPENPIRLTWSETRELFAIACYGPRQVVWVDPVQFGTVVETENVGGGAGSLYNVALDSDTSYVGLVYDSNGANRLQHRENGSLPLPAGSIFFDWNDSTRTAVAVMHGEDLISVVQYHEIVGVGERVSFGSATPRRWDLTAAYPNPFNGQVTLNYTLPERGAVQIAAYDLLGREAAVLLDDTRPAGSHTLTWKPSDLPSGTYFIRMNGGGRQVVRKVALVR